MLLRGPAVLGHRRLMTMSDDGYVRTEHLTATAVRSETTSLMSDQHRSGNKNSFSGFGNKSIKSIKPDLQDVQEIDSPGHGPQPDGDNFQKHKTITVCKFFGRTSTTSTRRSMQLTIRRTRTIFVCEQPAISRTRKLENGQRHEN